MKNRVCSITLYFIIGIFILSIIYVTAYPFVAYNHDAFWNDTAETTNATFNNWTTDGTTVWYNSTYYAANGSNAIQFYRSGANGLGYNNFPDAANTNYNLTLKFFDNATETYQLTKYVGITNWSVGSGQGCGAGDARSYCIGLEQNNQTVYVANRNGGRFNTSVNRSTGWHTAEWRVLNGTNISFYLDGNNIENVTGYTVSTIMTLYSADTVNFTLLTLDDVHAWNSSNESLTNQTPTLASLTNATPARSNVSINWTVTYNDDDGDIGNVTFMHYVNGTNVFNETRLNVNAGTQTSSILYYLTLNNLGSVILDL